jgi:glycosyltransferase involved in cell wall biosynthesis/ubiquinone/menaquinone biosynthesis C-methylase UbiE
MNILFVLTYYTPHWTGLTQHAKRLAEGLVKKGHKATVVTTQHDAELPLADTIDGVEVIRSPVWFRLSRTLVSPLFFVRVWQGLRQADCVIAYTPLAEVVFVSLMAKLQGKRLLLLHNGDLILPKGTGNRMIEILFDLSGFISGRLADQLIAYTQDYAKHSRFLQHFPDKTTAILPLFPTIRKKTSILLPKNRHPVIGFAGRFVEEKGFDVLLAAIPKVIKQYPNALFVFAGETHIVYEQFYEKNLHLIEQVRKNFFSLGRLSQEEMQGFYQALDVFVLPSRSDCLAFVQAEAMLAGVPVVATNIPGARVPLSETGMGELVQVEDPEDLAKGIISVLRNKSKYKKKIGFVKRMFDYEQTLAKYEEILQGDPLQSYLFHELDPAFARRARILISELQLTGNEKILEIGCGRGYYEGLLRFLYPNLSITAIDRKDEYLAIARNTVSGVTFKNADALHLPWKANTFDRVFATEVLEHLSDDEKALSQMYRVLKHGGRALITVPNKHYPFWWDPLNWTLEHLFHTHVSKDIWWLAGIWADHERLYEKDALMQKAKDAGFTITNVFLSTHHSIPFAHFLLYGIGKNIVERGFLPGFYRFNPKRKSSILFSLVRSIIYSQDHKNNDSEEDGVSTVNIILSLQKK